MSIKNRLFVSIAIFLISVPFVSHAVAATSDQKAIVLANQAVAALTGAQSINDATLSGSATWTVGSNTDTGPAMLRVKGQYESRLDLNLTAGTWTEIRNSTNFPQGNWISTDGTVHEFAQHNCWTDVAWFFPGLSSLLSAPDPNMILSYIGQETFNGSSVQHVQATWFGLQLSTVDYYLDSNSSLPVAIAFNAHPDQNMNANVPVQITFGDYRQVSGAQVPFHIQKSVQGSLLLDFAASAATLNSGLSDSLFVVQ